MTILVETLKNAAKDALNSDNIVLLELRSYDPFMILLGLKESLDSVKLKDKKAGYLKMSMHAFVKDHLLTMTGEDVELTGSCGATSGWLYGVVGGTQANPASSQDTRVILNQLWDVKSPRWFCRLSCGEHSFLIEFADGQYAVYQSFFGSQHLGYAVRNILGKKYVFHDKDDFLSRLAVSLCDPHALADKSPTASSLHFKLTQDASGMKQDAAQASVFHGKHWTIKPQSQIELEASPPSADKIGDSLVQNIKIDVHQWNDLLADNSPLTLEDAFKRFGLS